MPFSPQIHQNNEPDIPTGPLPAIEVQSAGYRSTIYGGEGPARVNLALMFTVTFKTPPTPTGVLTSFLVTPQLTPNDITIHLYDDSLHEISYADAEFELIMPNQSGGFPGMYRFFANGVVDLCWFAGIEITSAHCTYAANVVALPVNVIL
ncbi:MAG: hypothetical protein ABI068_14055 [Ktedonobacterales bacterium]